MNSSINQILDILSKIRPEIDFRDSTDYLADGLLDSFDIVTLVSDLDSGFGICIPGTEITPDHFRNAESIAEIVNRYRNA
jgi:acyl carrier protein